MVIATGIEFTIQAITDGDTIIFPPPTYDYPYRFDTDSGPGTGGMGSFSADATQLPFVSEDHYKAATKVVRSVIAELRNQGRHFNGILNAGFFATSDGLRAIEFNARFGDPEAMNIMRLLSPGTDWIRVMRQIACGQLTTESISFQKKSSVVVYLVSPEYALSTPKRHVFNLDPELAHNTDVDADALAFFASARATGKKDEYETVGASRALAISATGFDLEDARKRAYQAVEECGAAQVLEFRKDIGSREYIDRLREGGAGAA